MRWTAKRKAAIVAAVGVGEITAADVERDHGVSSAELEAWRRDLAAYGLKGLKVKRRQPDLRRIFDEARYP